MSYTYGHKVLTMVLGSRYIDRIVCFFYMSVFVVEKREERKVHGIKGSKD